jgi:hypothetical protein
MITAYNLMMVMIFSGIALCGAYFRARYMEWRDQQTAEVEKQLRVRLLYRDESSRPQESVVGPGGVPFADLLLWYLFADLVGVRANTAIPETVEAPRRRQTLPLRNAA